MTDNRTTELLPCPFCGGEARIFELRFGTGWRVLCSKSFCAQGPDGATEAEAIAAWNTRATHSTLTADDVRDIIEHHSYHVSGNMREFFNGTYVEIADELNACEERTCRNTQSDFDFMCSECGKCVDNGRAIRINYCPSCGAKIVQGVDNADK